MKFLTCLWKTSSFDLQTRSSGQEQQYGCHGNALPPEIFLLRGFINKHAKPSSYSVIVWVRVVLKRTVVGDWSFENLSGSHLQSQVNSVCQAMIL